MSTWNPRTHPYRVRKIRTGGPYGWSDSVRTYAEYDKAVEDMNAKMTGGEYEAELDQAVPDPKGGWMWKRLATRKINKKAIFK